jgi:hypothetical protein
MAQRIKRHPFLALFDGADTNVSTAHRDMTTVPTQSLFLMNDPFLHAQSLRFAERLIASATEDERRMTRAFQWTLARPPDSGEQARSAAFLARYQRELAAGGASANEIQRAAWAAFARTLFARNEFLFVD